MMSDLFGKEIKREDITKRVGSLSQIADARMMAFEEGKARGMRCVEVKTGSGLTFTVLPERGLDICWAEFKGNPFSYISKSEVCTPQFFQENGDKGFLDNFFGGLLTTAGLSNVGAANEDEGVKYGLHGTISNIPANDVAIEKVWVDDEYHITIKGTVRQSRFYGEDLVLRRKISTKMGSNEIVIEDEIENQGFVEQPVMILYHLNFGFPFVSANSKLYMNDSEVVERTPEAKVGLENWQQILEPIHGYQEQCFYHDFVTSEDGEVRAEIFNPKIAGEGLGVYIKYQKDELPRFCQWKQMGEQEYVMGLIPANAFAEGRHEEKQNGRLEILKPKEVKKIKLTIGIREGMDA